MNKFDKIYKILIGHSQIYDIICLCFRNKLYKQENGNMVRKANCDVDLTFDMMRYMSQYSEAVVLSGDGDFAPILEYLKRKKKK